MATVSLRLWLRVPMAFPCAVNLLRMSVFSSDIFRNNLMYSVRFHSSSYCVNEAFLLETYGIVALFIALKRFSFLAMSPFLLSPSSSITFWNTTFVLLWHLLRHSSCNSPYSFHASLTCRTGLHYLTFVTPSRLG
jgi:hypothetical protein